MHVAAAAAAAAVVEVASAVAVVIQGGVMDRQGARREPEGMPAASGRARGEPGPGIPMPLL